MANMTYVEAIEVAISTLAHASEGNGIVDESNATVIEKLEALKVQLAKRGSSKTLTKTQKENEVLKDTIAEVLGGLEKATVSELQASDERLSDFSNQKISALLRQMVSDGRVVKTIEGKKAYFALTA